VVDVLRKILAADPAGRTVPRVLVAHFNDGIANLLLAAVKQAGYDGVKVNTGREVMKRLREAADIDLLVLDGNLPDPGFAQLLGQIKSDVNAKQLPLVLFTSLAREDALRRFVERYRNVVVTTEEAATEPKELAPLLRTALGDPHRTPLLEAELTELREQAMNILGALARQDVPGYDVRPAAETVYRAMQAGKLSPVAQANAISFISHMSGSQPQTELFNVLASARDAGIRALAAAELARHIQQHTLALNAQQVTALERLAAQKELDPQVRSGLASVLGSLRPGARLTGERLQQYRPPTPMPPMPPMMPLPMMPPGGQ
jgi:CheY-like chemotaxis protein